MYSFEDFKKGDAFDLGTIVLTEEEMIAFARRYDPQPFHVSPEQAEATLFGGLIASGWHTIVLFMERFARVVLNNTISLASPGADEIRWLKPVRSGEILTARVVVVDCRPSSSRTEMGIVCFRWEITNQAGESVLTLQSMHFLGRKS